MEIRKMYLIIASIVTVLSICAFCVLFFHGGYDDKILSKLGLKEPKTEKNRAVYSWNRCLEKLHYDSDIAFIGDSLTEGGDFQKCFPEKRIINLGLGGDTIVGLTERVSMLAHSSPDKVFIMVGINGLTNMNRAICLKNYSILLTSVKTELPEAEIYVQSVLPISEEKEKELICNNTTIKAFNKELKKLAEQNKMTYIDLYPVFVEDNQIKKDLTYDGLHVNTRGYEVWMDSIKDYIK